MPLLVENLKHTYAKGTPDEHLALDGVTFQIDDKEIVSIIGHTGSGKSTLTQHLNGLLKADSGKITVNGLEVTAEKADLRSLRRQVGLVFQYPEYQLFEETVAEDVAFGPKNMGITGEELEETVRKAIELVGLDYEQFKDKSPFELSGGQKRRVAIAGVVAMRPKVLILDEPTAGLDPKAHEDILRTIQKIHDEEENITVIVSHNMDDVAAMSDKVLVMNGGKAFLFGTVDEIFAKGDKLREIGLNVPKVTEFMTTLKESGIALDDNCLDIDIAAQRIAEALKSR